MMYLWVIGLIAVLFAVTLGETACFIAFVVMMLGLMVYELKRAKMLADDGVYFDWDGEDIDVPGKGKEGSNEQTD